MLRTTWVLLGAFLLLAGCAGRPPLVEPGTPLSLHKEAEFIKVPLQPARNLWATIRQTGRSRILYAQGKCARKEWGAAECAQIAKDIETAQQLSWEVTRALDNPKADLDLEKIGKILQITAKIVGALAP